MKLFISYSRTDEAFVRKLATKLSDAGVDIWLDVDDIPAGMKWSTAIQQGLDACEIMIVVISPDSMASRNVEDEWQYYLDEKKHLVPILLNQAKVHFQLRRIQYIDFLNLDFDSAFAKLLTQLDAKGVLKTTGSTGTTSTTVQPTPSVGTRPASSAASPKQKASYSIPVDAQVVYERANSLVREGNYDEAGKLYRQALKIAERDGILDWKDAEQALLNIQDLALARELIAEGDRYMASDSWREALRKYEGALRVLPNSFQAKERIKTFHTLEIARAFKGKRNSDWTPIIQTFTVHGIDFEMCLVPPGSFQMGSEDGGNDEKPVHTQTFTEPFWIGLHPVTNAQWRAAVANSGGAVEEPNLTGWYNEKAKDQHPVVGVTWHQCIAFANWLGWRLPSEREWEYAARGLDNLVYPFGNDFQPDLVVYAGNSNYRTAAVGGRPNDASWVGAQDMSGNVWEWIMSAYAAYPYTLDVEDVDKTNVRRVLRGGSWDGSSHGARAAYRDPYPDLRYLNHGVRLCRPPSL